MRVMKDLPIIVWDEILSYLNAIDKYFAIEAFALHDIGLRNLLFRRMNFQLDYRLTINLMRKVIFEPKLSIKELDLTGIYWIPQHKLMANIIKLINLESLFLIGSSVILKDETDMDRFCSLENLKIICVCIDKKFAYCRNIVRGDIYYAITTRNKRARVSHETKWEMNFKAREISFGTVYAGSFLRFLTDLQKEFCKNNSVQEEENISRTETERSVLDTLRVFREKKYFKLFEERRLPKTLIVGRSEMDKYTVTIRNLGKKRRNFYQRLHFDGDLSMSTCTLKTIFRYCPKLKRLGIKWIASRFPYTDLKYVPHLEDLAIVMKHPKILNAEKLFYDLNRLKLPNVKRIFLKGLQIDIKSKQMLEFLNFHTSNLVFLFIISDFTHKQLQILKKILHGVKKFPYQYFECAKLEFNIDTIPLIHRDMIHSIEF